MKKQTHKTLNDLNGFLKIAHNDYLSARLLLLNNLLPQGVQQAATTIEKLFKALILIKGNRCRGHLEKNLVNNIENKYPVLFKELNQDFITFLRKGYKLRYHDDKDTQYTLVINQYRTLIELDRMVFQIHSGLQITSNDKEVKTDYQQGIDNADKLLFENNYLLNKTPLMEFCKRENQVYEVSFKDSMSPITASYVTIAVNMNGSFLKPVNLSIPKNGQTASMKLTLG